MLKYLENKPSKKMNRLFLIIGIIIFIPVYYLNYLTLSKILESDVLTKLLTSFDTDYFKEVISSIGQRGQLNDFFTVYLLNIVSVIGVALILFSLTLIIARSITKDSKLYKISFIFPVIVMIIALLDILPSITFLIVIKKPDLISDFTTCFIDGSYILRSIFIYLEFLWIIVMGVFLIVKNSKKKKYNPESAS
ncbi:MAG: hypothetical protein ACP5FZ_02565 [Fidelibacterota bacterium]